MIPLSDPRWEKFVGGYGTPCGAAGQLSRLIKEELSLDQFWEWAWNELHHQGDVGSASFAALPHIVDHCVGRSAVDGHLLAFTCELFASQRVHQRPDAAMMDAARQALQRLLVHAICSPSADFHSTLCLSRLVALRDGHAKLAELLGLLEPAEVDRLLHRLQDGE